MNNKFIIPELTLDFFLYFRFPQSAKIGNKRKPVVEKKSKVSSTIWGPTGFRREIVPITHRFLFPIFPVFPVAYAALPLWN